MATFAPQPSEFEYPYYDARVAYDNSLEAAINANETAAGLAQNRADSAFSNADAARGVADKAVPFKGNAPAGDLNLVTELGVYRQQYGSQVTLANNYPVAGTATTIENTYGGLPDSVIQRVTVFNLSGYRWGTHSRMYSDGVWSAWRFQPTQRIDNTAGRAIYTWDDTANREQLIYGDTGWRVLTSWNAEGEVTGQPLPAGVAPYDGVAGFIRIRREGYSVRYGLAGYKITANSPVFLLPSGFNGGAPKVTYLPSTSASSGMILRTAKIGSIQIFASLVLGDSNADSAYASELEWSTNSPWPTTLPGTASGTIPFS